MAERKVIDDRLEAFEFYDETVNSLISRLEAVKLKYPDHLNHRLVGEPYGYDNGCDYSIVGNRLETDVEFKAREAHERKVLEASMLKAKKESETAKKKHDKEHKEYLRLKKKFEKSPQ